MNMTLWTHRQDIWQLWRAQLNQPHSAAYFTLDQYPVWVTATTGDCRHRIAWRKANWSIWGKNYQLLLHRVMLWHISSNRKEENCFLSWGTEFRLSYIVQEALWYNEIRTALEIRTWVLILALPCDLHSPCDQEEFLWAVWGLSFSSVKLK